jgi:hypothetical protein
MRLLEMLSDRFGAFVTIANSSIRRAVQPCATCARELARELSNNASK